MRKKRESGLKRVLIFFDVLVIAVMLILSMAILMSTGSKYLKRLVAEANEAHLIWIAENVDRNYSIMENIAFSVALDDNIRTMARRNAYGEAYSDAFAEMSGELAYIRQKFANVAETFDLRINSVVIFLNSDFGQEIVPETDGAILYDTELKEESGYNEFIASDELMKYIPADMSDRGNRYYGHDMSPDKRKDGAAYSVVSLLCKLQDYAATEVYGVVRINIRTEDFFSEAESVYGGDPSFAFQIFYGEQPVYANVGTLDTYEVRPLEKYGMDVRFSGGDDVRSAFVTQLLGALLAVLCMGVLMCILTVLIFNAMYRRIISGINDFDVSGRPAPSRFREINEYFEKFRAMMNKIDALTRERYALEKKQQQAKLLSLQYQINPHFLFNMLEVFRSRADMTGDTEVADAISDFADILRYNISDADALSTLRAETDMLVKFVGLFRFKYKDTLRISIAIDDGLEDTPMLKFLLQPLAENAIRHGKRKNKPMRIEVRAFRSGENIHIETENDGAAIPPGRLEEIRAALEGDGDGTGIGLKNVRDRLRLYYGQGASLSILSEENRTAVLVIFPLCGKGGELCTEF